LHELQSCRIGLALSGGSVRGLAHIGVIKALDETGVRPWRPGAEFIIASDVWALSSFLRSAGLTHTFSHAFAAQRSFLWFPVLA
jgi:NTE family protein